VSLAAVCEALVDVLEARSALAGVPVTIGGPANAEDLESSTGKYEAIWIGDARAESVAPPVMGVPLWLDERYTVDVIVQVLKLHDSADTQQAAMDRCDALFHQIVGALSTDPTLAMTFDSSLRFVEAVPESWEATFGHLPNTVDAHGARYVLRVGVHARLTLT
jgi:hypothetical protein